MNIQLEKRLLKLYTLFVLFVIALTVNSIAPCASLQAIPVHKCKTDIWTGPALPQMKYTTINPPVYISGVLASCCLLCSDWAPVVTWTTALCLKPPCEDLLPWHLTHDGGIFEGGNTLEKKTGKSRKIDQLCFSKRQKHSDEGQGQKICNKYVRVAKWNIRYLIKVTHVTKISSNENSVKIFS